MSGLDDLRQRKKSAGFAAQGGLRRPFAAPARGAAGRDTLS